ncbi:MAG TPA: hypothetical protein PLJ27_08475 [Polyangiaceae bacterium]|jgi:hypothetical protein|nr:MAG: hypothetical protein BWY17_02210 [Deltaproteobacteria bacterium ADurb.Bin207]HOD22627.1 hypothetical protein [Polyangiaceae bacterium]HOH02451.1 hypothetical protein [Polyangiaceae bacterium]HOR36591.1 hypothetical protein [Polyangiaceae bacterium]HOT10725.1 hypothetical protein [Polyangiaceae bacterium]
MGKMIIPMVLGGLLILGLGCSDPVFVSFPDGHQPEMTDEPSSEAATASEPQPSQDSVEAEAPSSPWPFQDAGRGEEEAQERQEGGVVEGEADAEDAMPSTMEPLESKVFFIQPSEGAALSNPLFFEIGARHVDYVQIFSDSIPLTELWEPVLTKSGRLWISEPGFHSLRLVGYDQQHRERAWDEITITVTE